MSQHLVGNENVDVWADHTSGGSLTTRYLRGDIVDQLFARQDAGTQYWYLTDHLGSIRDVINNSAVVKDSIGYNAFGEIISETDANFRGRYTWTGREFDTETTLQYNRARYYDAKTGRWISQDPLGFDAGDSNLYRYVKNYFSRRLDPSGLVQVEVKVAAYIGKHVGGPWLPEPGSILGWEFSTDYRDAGEDFKKARIRSWFIFDTDNVGKIKQEDFKVERLAGESHRRRSVPAPEGGAGNVYMYDTPMTAEVSGKESALSLLTRADNGLLPDCIAITGLQHSNSGGYPYVALSPNIDYDLNLIVMKYKSKDGVYLGGVFAHDLFPDYEVIINGKVFSFQTSGTGPGIVNLNSSQTEAIKQYKL